MTHNLLKELPLMSILLLTSLEDISFAGNAMPDNPNLPDSLVPPPHLLFTPHLDGAKLSYIREDGTQGVVYRHASASAIVNDTDNPTPAQSHWGMLREEKIKHHGGNPWGRWGSM